MYQSSNKKELLSLAPENGFQKFKYSFHHWQQERLQISHLDGFPELLPIPNLPNCPIYHFTHTKPANAALSMHKWCLKQPGSSHYLDGWQKDYEAFHMAVALMVALTMIQTATEWKVVSHRLQPRQEQVSRSKHVTLSSLIIYSVADKHSLLSGFILKKKKKKGKSLLNCLELCRIHLKIMSKMLNF